MGNNRSAAMKDAYQRNSALAGETQAFAGPLMDRQSALIQQGMADKGQPQYVQKLYALQRGMLKQQYANQSQSGVNPAVAGGNQGAGLLPQGNMAQLAQGLGQSHSLEQAGGLEQMNALRGMSLGQTNQMGGQVLAAAGGQLQMLGYQPAVDLRIAGGMGALSAAGSIYGGIQQQKQNNALQQYLLKG